MNKNSESGKTLIVIPVFNEAGNIEGVIECIKKEVPYADILVVDDGSSDDTRDIAETSATWVISHPFNMGYGVALQTGFKYAMERGYDFVVQMDGDGQHEPKYINDLLNELRREDVDIIIGSRFLSGTSYKSQPVRRLGIMIFALIASLITRQKITDPTSGFQALNKKVVKLYASEVYPTDFPDADVIIMVSLIGYKIKEIPVVMYQSASKISMHSGLKPLYYIFKMFLSIIVTLFRKRQNLEEG